MDKKICSNCGVDIIGEGITTIYCDNCEGCLCCLECIGMCAEREEEQFIPDYDEASLRG